MSFRGDLIAVEMQWPSWLFWRQQSAAENDKKREVAPSKGPPSPPAASLPTRAQRTWDQNLNRTDWSHFTTTQTIVISLITTGTTLALVKVYKTYIRRIPTIEYLKPGFFRRRSFYGYVTRVGDGDNFHFFHTPGGRMMGWGWLSKRRRVQDMKGKEAKGRTLHVRIAGVDAPELAHFGRPEQPYGQEAIEWLRSFILHKYVRVYPYRQDQYSRVVCSVHKRRFLFFKSDVGLEMLKRGLATVYEAKFGSEFGNKEEEYRSAEQRAKDKKVGMWQEPGIIGRMMGQKQNLETPREYKTRMTKQEKKAELAK